MKPSRHLAQLVIRDLAQISGLAFKHPDRLTRAEATQVREWATKQPAVVQAMRDKGHGEHAAVRLFADMVNHFAIEHPQGSDGEPAAWTQGRMLDLEAPISGMTADEAAARLAWAQTRPEYREAYASQSHPDHIALVRQTLMLNERMLASPQQHPAQDGAPEPAPGQPALSPDARSRIEQARSDPAFRDGRHPFHKQAVEAVAEAYRAAYPEPGTAAAPPGTTSPAEDRSRLLRGITEHPAYRDARHPEHGAKVAEMLAAHQTAAPEPPA